MVEKIIKDYNFNTKEKHRIKVIGFSQISPSPLYLFCPFLSSFHSLQTILPSSFFFFIYFFLSPFLFCLFDCSGAQLVNFERGRRYIYDRKDEILDGLSPSMKCVAPLFRDMSLAKL